jgi:signal transduction histidine kinase
MPQRFISPEDRTRVTRLADRLSAPTITILLLTGALFVAVAWASARDAGANAQRKDERRAQHTARAVSTVIGRRWTDLAAWLDEHRTELTSNNPELLQRTLQARASGDGATTVVGWVAVRADGSILAVGEASPGRIAASGLSDDLRLFGRQVSTRQREAVSDRLRFGDDTVYAAGVPIIRADGRSNGALMAVFYVDRSGIGAFIPSNTPPDAVDATTLRDARGRTVSGPRIPASEAIASSPVDNTGWTVGVRRQGAGQLLPTWTFPAFALLLMFLAVLQAVGEARRRRLTREGAERVRHVRTLYDLSSRVLHSRTVRDQAELLAGYAVELGRLDGARVRIALERDTAGVVAGIAAPGQREYRVALTGPRAPIGELVAYRRSRPLTAEERSIMQTAATLVGAAMHTTFALEAERATAVELHRLDELRSNLLATVAHELRSPLTAVKGVLGLLSMQEDLGDRTRQYVDLATERTDRLVALIQDLFDCSLLETGQLDIRPQRQLASELLDAALGAQAAARPGELLLSATPNLPITVDPVRFDQLVNNLVTNAFRHGATPVEVIVRPANGGVNVIVMDEGPGIPESARGEIFGKFWQGSTGHAREAQGAGLGLSLVQGLVRLHGGDIEIDSVHADGRGARFTAFFPDVVPDLDPTAVRSRVMNANDDVDLDPITRII